jgi:predicted ATPase/class 3 adenylate cyclase
VPAALPTGTVSLLFTDIEGSTRLLESLGPDRYGELLSAHHRACRASFAEHGGVEVDTAGDAFFVVFASASAGLSAAATAQAALAQLGLRVRMGIHTGDVTLRETGYVGLEVHRSARIAAAAHGGQVLVSQAAAAILGSRVSELRDLGVHRFKDLGEAERIFQLGDLDFPPIRTLARSNLPVPSSRFLGRRQEVEDVAGMLARDDVRLLTLTGPGGIGKTRLALQAAAEVSDVFPDGVWWQPLAPLGDAADVLSSLGKLLNPRGEAGRDVLDVVADRLAGRRMLLVMDNAEHLLPALATVLARLRDVAPTVCLLVTSRERLQLAGEQIWLVPALAEADGVELFVSRALSLGAVVSDTPVVRELCARLDNLPLALELAAARTGVFSPTQLLSRLGQRLDLLKGGRDADPRQQTLRATIDWSYRALDEHERRVFRSFAVFPDGCSYDGAEAVAGADPDVLQSLLDKSLLRRIEGAHQPRFAMLETIREYALERLAEAGENGPTWERFDRFVHPLIRTVSLDYSTSADISAETYAEERAGIRLAIDRLRSSPVALASVVVDLFLIWSDLGEFEVARHVVQIVEDSLNDLPPQLRARFLVAAGIVVGNGGEPERGVALARQAFAMLEAGDDELWLGRALCCEGSGLANMAFPGPAPAAMLLLERGLLHSQASGDDLCVAFGLINLADLAQRAGDVAGAEQRMVAATVVARRMNHSGITGYLRAKQAELARLQGDLDGCVRLVREILLADGKGAGSPSPMMVAGLVDELIEVALQRGDFEEAALLAGATETVLREGGLVSFWFDHLDGQIARLGAVASADTLAAALASGRAMTTPELLAHVRSHSPDGGEPPPHA